MATRRPAGTAVATPRPSRSPRTPNPPLLLTPNEDLRWVANSATMIYGDQEAVLVHPTFPLPRPAPLRPALPPDRSRSRRFPPNSPGDTIRLEDHELRVIDTGHTDTMATSVLWCPSLPPTAHCPRESPRLVTSSRRQGPDPLAHRRGYKHPAAPTTRPTSKERSMSDRLELTPRAGPSTPSDLYQAVLQEHPRRANPGSLWGAAKMAKGA